MLLPETYMCWLTITIPSALGEVTLVQGSVLATPFVTTDCQCWIRKHTWTWRWPASQHMNRVTTLVHVWTCKTLMKSEADTVDLVTFRSKLPKFLNITTHWEASHVFSNLKTESYNWRHNHNQIYHMRSIWDKFISLCKGVSYEHTTVYKYNLYACTHVRVHVSHDITQ